MIRGASPTVCSVIGDKYNIIILVETIEKETEQNTKVIVYDDYNSRVRCDADVGTIGAITTNIGASALRNGYKLIIAYG